MWKKITISAAITGATIFGAGTVADDVAIANLPQSEKLATTTDRLIDSQLVQTGDGPVIKYRFKGNPVKAEPKEVVAQRSDKARIYTTNKPGVLNMHVYAPGSFAKEIDGSWITIDSATTTQNAFDLQTKSLLQRIITTVRAANTTAFETKDTYWGDTFAPGPNDTTVDLRIGGWGDHYYSFLEWDLTGLPTAAEATLVNVCLNPSQVATNWANVKARRITSSWTAATLTRTVTPTDAGTTGEIALTQIVSIDTYYCTDVTTFYDNWKDGTWSNFGMKLADSGVCCTDSQSSYYSSDQAGTSKDPYLDITYTPTPAATTPVLQRVNNGTLWINNGTLDIGS